MGFMASRLGGRGLHGRQARGLAGGAARGLCMCSVCRTAVVYTCAACIARVRMHGKVRGAVYVCCVCECAHVLHLLDGLLNMMAGEFMPNTPAYIAHVHTHAHPLRHSKAHMRTASTASTAKLICAQQARQARQAHMRTASTSSTAKLICAQQARQARQSSHAHSKHSKHGKAHMRMSSLLPPCQRCLPRGRCRSRGP